MDKPHFKTVCLGYADPWAPDLESVTAITFTTPDGTPWFLRPAPDGGFTVDTPSVSPDDLDPLCEAIRDNLPAKSRRVLDALIKIGVPATAAEVGAKARLNVNFTSSLLGRLVKKGYVSGKERNRKVKVYSVSKTYETFAAWVRERQQA